MSMQTTNGPCRAGSLLLGVTLALGIFAIAPAQAANRTWNGSQAPDLNWSTDANWNSPFISGSDAAIFNSVGAAAATNTITSVVDDDYEVTSLSYAWNDATLFHNTQIAANTTLTVRGTLGVARLASESYNTSATISGLSGSVLQLGTATALDVVAASFNGPFGGTQRGTLRISGVEVDSTNLRNVTIGIGTGTGNGFGTLDFTGATFTDNKLTIAGNLHMGQANQTSGRGDLIFDSSLDKLVINGWIRLGYGTNRDNVGRLTLASGTDLQIGSLATPVSEITLGRGNTSNYGNTANIGTIMVSNAVFTAYATDLTVGHGFGNDTLAGTGLGTLDASTASVTLGISGMVRVGTYGVGTAPSTTVRNSQLKLGAGTVTTATLEVGSQYTGMRGLLELNGTVFSVGSTATVKPFGTINVTVGGTSAGLDLASADSLALAVDSGGVINVVFESEPDISVSDIHWGLRWAGGDHTAILQGMLDNGRLLFNATALPPAQAARYELGYDAASNVTYIGQVIPARGTMLYIRWVVGLPCAGNV